MRPAVTRQTAVVGPGEGFTTTGDLHTAVDTGWLLVGVAGVAGGLALVLVGAGIATAPLLLPAGLLLAVGAYLAWAAGSARIVATVYEGVGDPGRTAAADGPGRPEDRTDPDGNWRSTAADGGTASGESGATTDDGPRPGERLGDGGDAEGDRRHGRTDSRRDEGLGPNGERIWDARERDRVGGWDDWDAGWEWADRHWRSFQEEYDDADWTDDEGRRATGETSNGGRRTAGRAGARQRAQQHRRRRDGRRHRERRRRTGPGERGRVHRERRADSRAERARAVLGVSADADAETVREAYRARVKEVHPDRGGDPERFKQVQWAYEYLTEG